MRRQWQQYLGMPLENPWKTVENAGKI